MCKKQNHLQSKQTYLDCATPFEAAGSVVTVKRSPVSTRVKARDTARGTDKIQYGSVEATTRTR
jgi:hypothetical protein